MNIAVFCGASSPKNEEYTAAARELGRSLAEGDHTLLYGGSNLGLMGEVSGEALRCGGHVVGVIPTLFSEDIIRSQAVTELVRVASMAERKEYLIAHSDAFVALPGGIGTLDEVSEVMVANQLQHLNKPMVLLNLDGFYDPFLNQLHVMHDAGFVRKGAETALHTVASVDEVIKLLAAAQQKSINLIN